MEIPSLVILKIPIFQSTSPGVSRILNTIVIIRIIKIAFSPLKINFTGTWEMMIIPARNSVAIEDLEDYPFLAFEQGEKNSFYFSEEILSTIPRKKVIYVSDRATLFNLLIGLNGYTICSGILNRNLNGDSIMAVPLETEENMVIGWIGDPRIHLSEFAGKYLEELHRLISSQS